ncbi:response regulator transcription factor [Bacillus wiedmannii]|uniref:response regulator transcription factor n=1 Tax=Bacillus wiedmannii TaxID=1890302 RepID=UPI000BFC11DA|nr:response regulator transcription factor [Bacillus wiedmannii]PHA62881.1 hypothetical protein COE75_16745 [Bacillus wiedmannii]
MAFSTQQSFVGVLDGTDVTTLNKKINYKKTKLEERKQVVEEIVHGTDFYNQYFSSYFKANINAGDSLSHNVNVCKSLERMANYLLNSEEIKKEEDESITQYVFHSDPKYFQKKVERDASLEGMGEALSNGHYDAVIHFLKREGKNHKVGKDQLIKVEDIERPDELGQILKSYHEFRDYLTEELTKKKSKHNRYLLTKAKGQVDHDMKYIKDYFLRIFGYDLKSFSESTNYDLDVFDFTNELHLKGAIIESESGKPIVAKGLLYFQPSIDPNSDFDHILWDLQNTIDKAGLTEEEKFVLEGIRSGWTQEEIAQDLNTYQKKISRTIDVIARKVSRVGNKYDAKRGEA